MTARDPSVLPGPGVHLIEASAGTGKTYVLSQLYLAAVIGQGRTPSEILVVTYTEAAARELQVRVHAMLRDAMALLSGREPAVRDAAALRALVAREVAIAGSEDEARARLAIALARYDERRISTIHAFAAWVLAEFPLETGVVPGTVRLVDGTSRWREAADDLWRERSTGAHGAAFAAQYGKPDELVKLAKPFRQFPIACIVPSASDEELVEAQARLGAAYAAAARAWQDGAAVAANLLLKVKNVLTQKKGAYDIPGVNEATEAWRGYFEAGEAEASLAERAELYTHDAMMRHRTPGAIRNAVPLPQHPVFDALTELWRAHRLVRGIRTARTTTALVAELERRARALMAAAGERSFDDLIGVLHGALTGAQGAQLARALRVRLPLGLIDEFQDTDARQYEIFRRVYVPTEDEPATDVAPSLILVGDPKQSIYRFRGGDVYAYRIASADVRGEPARLERNYRSEPVAVDAVNALFRDVSFRLEFVRYHPVEPVRPTPQVLRDPALDAGLVLWDAGTGNGRGHKQDALIEWSLATCADEIVRLLSGEVRVEREGRTEPLTPDDIAVLLPWNRDVTRMARVLEARGVGVRLEARESVYESESASDLYAVLCACTWPDDAGLVRAALAVRGFDWTAGRLLNPDEGAYTEARATFRRWHEAWLAHGHDAVLAPLVARLAPALAQREDGARRLTDLRHLVERLGAAPVSADAPASLLAFLAERMGAREITEEADALRPEAGEKRVRVMTAHKSKGLEFGVVFLPLAWQPPVPDREPVVAFHDDAGQVCLDLAPEPDGDSRTRARAEQLADAVRVAYVTLTRARHRTYAVAGRIWYHSGGAAAGLAQILLGEGVDNYDRLDQAAWDAAIGARVREMDAGAALAHLPLPRPSRRRLDPGPPPALPEAAELARELPRVEPTWSYSALKRLGETVEPEREPRPGVEDELAAGEESYRGARFGRCFHELMEELPFEGRVVVPDAAQLRRATQRHGLEPGAGTLLVRLCAATLAAEVVPGLVLHSLAPERSGREVPFLLRLEGARVAELAALLGRHPQYERSAAALAADPARLSGWMRGYLDLVFEAEGRYYVLDYKTDLLAGPDAYAPGALASEVAARAYDLQYLLYGVAVRRWLRQRYGAGGEARFGGAVYLFVRGLGSGPGQGVFRSTPPPALLAEIESLLAGAMP